MKFSPSKCIIFFHFYLHITEIKSQAGPEPWHSNKEEINIPTTRRKSVDVNYGIGGTSFKRILALIMKSNQIKNSDGTIDLNLRMKFSTERWEVLKEYLEPDVTLTEDMYRRTLGFVEEAIYKPTIIETMTMAWSDYVQVYLTEYQVYITWTLGISSILGVIIWLWSRMSHKHIIIVILVLLYIYEVVVSYKEAEQQEVKRFIAAVNSCKWYFWRSDCDVPTPDLVVFMKHMNPGKIAIKMFTNWISEPMICMSTTVNTIIHGVTDGLWYPLNVILYGFLTVGTNIMLIILFIILIFNYFFNTSYNLGFFFFNVGILQRNRAAPINNINNGAQGLGDNNRIGGPALDRLLEIFAHAVQRPNANEARPALNEARPAAPLPIRRVASVGQLQNLNAIEYQDLVRNVRRRRNLNI